MTLDFTQQQIEALMNYLATRPWGEVNAILVPMLEQINKPQQPQQPELHAVEG